MSYQITFRGMNAPAAITLPNDRGEKIKAIWMGAEPSHKIEVDNDIFLASDIKRITWVPDPMPVLPSQQQLPSGKPKCKAQYSIQLEIMRMAKDLSGKDNAQNPGGRTWAKLLQDKKWKEQLRLELRAQPGVLWCDGKAGDCACDPEKPGKDLSAVKEIFGAVK